MAFRETTTRNGTQVIIFGNIEIGKRPIMGCYFTGEEFIPTSWLPSGNWFDDESTHTLDLVDYETS